MEDEKHRLRKEAAERKSHRKREHNSERQHERDIVKDKNDRGIEKKDRNYRKLDKGKVSENYRESRHSDARDREKDSRSRHRVDKEKEIEKEKVKDSEKYDREKLKERIRDRGHKRFNSERAKDYDSEDERDTDLERKRTKREDSVRARSRERERERTRDRYKDDDDVGKDHSREREREHNRGRHRDDGDGGSVRERERNKGNRHRDRDNTDDDSKNSKIVDGKRKKEENNEEANAKEDIEEEQRRLDEEMEKRRRRVQEWQELKRKEKKGDEKIEAEPKFGKRWTLEGEDSDDETLPVSKVNGDFPGLDEPKVVENVNKNMQNGEAMENDEGNDNPEDEIDPLDAFMSMLVVPEAGNVSRIAENSLAISRDGKEVEDSFAKVNKRQPTKGTLGRILPGEDSDADYDEGGDDDAKKTDDEDDNEFMKRVKKSKVEKLSVVDHSKIQYPPFRKNFLGGRRVDSQSKDEEVVAYRKDLELKIRGKDVPRPIKKWAQIGLNGKVLEVIKKLGFEKPMSIQAQALPIIMSGRDCIGIAKTGSGKTLAFVLPMLRHIKDQPSALPGDGPIGLIMAPTRELVQQIHSDIKKFSKVLRLHCVPVYGGSGIAQQISDLKQGTDIVVCTPGRMIDILCTSAGKITNLRRVTYLVMDEADRMFDMGFEPQITKIVQNTRPDRQTVLFSATFPRQVEVLARKVLNKPVEIQVGGRSVVNKDITQTIEVRPEGERFLRLLELLGEWYEKGKTLVFVHSQEKCDSLFKELLRHGYPCVSLHGAKDQTDRESTISDFKSNVCNLLIATSVAARGLDVKELELVVNFDAPNHYEDYVHRVGRTGRAGRKGVSVTFISEEEERYAPDLVKALELSEQPIPEDLKKLADGFMAKVSQGIEHSHGTGYGGSGFKFNEEEAEARKAAKKAQAREYGFEEYDKSDSDSDDEEVRKAGGDIAHAAAVAQAAAFSAASKANMASMSSSFPNTGVLSTAGSTIGVLPGDNWLGGTPNVLHLPGTSLHVPGLSSAHPVPNDAAARAQALAAALNLQHNLAKIQNDAMPEHYEAELEINDFPQNARWKVTHKETLGPIREWTGAAITTRGQFYPPGKFPGPGERKLYMFIEGPTESSVKKAKSEVKRVLEDFTVQSHSLPGSVQPGKYSVL
ncbi:hypothetical protein KI387_018888 [Taxus chinensis]|uniref:RNA helicase n=1 Tax=Taxus chinensis TaxID=29808 RepID=A0AA38L9U6_TAXCH|nr:hypothetical protein KI387_018888 [Taxus chinensis]